MNNVAALEILMDCGYGRALVLVILGAIARAVIGWCTLSAIGLQDQIWIWSRGDLQLGGLLPEAIFDYTKATGIWR